jgi:hypothetical protein
LNWSACSTSFATRSLPSTTGKPATSKIFFSGYIAVTCPPASGKESTTAVLNSRKPA